MYFLIFLFNPFFIGLYRSLGFEEVGLRKGFYSEPTEDALLMTKRYGET